MAAHVCRQTNVASLYVWGSRVATNVCWGSKVAALVSISMVVANINYVLAL